MKEKLLIFLALIFLVTLLIGLNAASYVQKEKIPDSELNPNRSSYNVGATGTRAFYDLLAETDRKVTRWQEPPSVLLNYDANSPSTFVVIGSLPREFSEQESEQLMQWVSQGGRLVIIDRNPLESLIKSTSNWKISVSKPDDFPGFNTDPADQKQMTAGEFAAKPIQPTIFTKKVNAVQPSSFSTSIKFERLANIPDGQRIESDNTSEEFYSEEEPPPPVQNEGSGSGTGDEVLENDNKEINSAPPPPADGENVSIREAPPESTENSETPFAPVVHLANDKKNILADFPFGSGQIILLTDPYIVSNGGINSVDNAQLAINVLTADGGIIAFDEYHHGYGSGNSRLLSYFEGTPVIAFLLQIAALIGLIFFTLSRRFARALPADEPNRLSKLEYVSAMAQLQERTKAFDLAVENVYKDFRRRVSRLVGVDNHTTSHQVLAALIAERSKLSVEEIENLMFKCEDIIRGEPTNKKAVVDLTGRLRRLENELGLQRRKTRKKAK